MRFILTLMFAFYFLFPHFDLNIANAFSSSGCEGDCRKCHSLNKQEVSGILKKMNLSHAKVLNIQMSPVKSLWEISIDDNGKKGMFYVDFSKKYILPGPIIEVSTGANKTAESVQKIPLGKTNFSKIPLNNALVMGNASAAKKVIVFTDPDCPYCGKLHQEMKKVLEKRKDIVFYIKLFPLKMHKDAYWKSKSIVCNKSLNMLEDNFENKPIPKTDCDTKEIDNNIKLAESLGITGTPTMIMPDGKIYSGAMPADKLIEMINRKGE